ADSQALQVFNFLTTDTFDITKAKYFSLSWHPWYVKKDTIEKQWQDLIQNPLIHQAVAIGECGLDALHQANYSAQLLAFERQIALANELQKPLVVHCVRAVPDCLRLLSAVAVPVIFHGVNFAYDKVKKILDAGYFCSFGQALSHSKTVKEYFPRLPLQQVFFETDDEDIQIQDVYSQASLLNKIAVESLKNQIFDQFKTVFRL
ncbi:MAG: TatD family deoxyribonuclease, partial [Flavobacterium sp.]